MPSSGRSLVIGGGIAVGSPFALDGFLYVQSITNPTAASFPGLVKGTNAVEAPGTQAPRTLRNTVIGSTGTGVSATAEDTIAIGTNVVSTVGGAGNGVEIAIGMNILLGSSRSIIIGDGGSDSTGTNAIGIGSGVGGLHNDMTAVGFGLSLGSSFNGVQIGKGSSSTTNNGSGSVVVGTGAGVGQSSVVLGHNAGGAANTTILVGNGISITGGGSTNAICIGASISAIAVDNAISIGNGASVQAGVIVIGNTNASGLGFSTSVLWGGASTHTAATPVPAWAVNHKNASGTNIAAGDVTTTGPLGTGTGVSGSLVFRTGAVVGAGTGQATATSVMRITNAQKVEVMLDNALTFVSQTSAAGASAGTLGNAPSAGNPGFWLRVVINGTNRFIPCW